MRFSIIIPAYNAAEHIEKALQSVASQSYRNYELIVVCDSCTDDTAEIAERYGAKVIRVDYQRDGLTRNAGLDAAQGEYILFIDDDDWLLHEYVLAMLDEQIRDEDMLLFGFIWKGRGYTRQTREQNNIACWCKCMKRSFIGNTRFSAIPYWSDVAFNQDLWSKGPRCAYWDMPLYYYNYLRPGSISWRQKQGEIT